MDDGGRWTIIYKLDVYQVYPKKVMIWMSIMYIIQVKEKEIEEENNLCAIIHLE